MIEMRTRSVSPTAHVTAATAQQVSVPGARGGHSSGGRRGLRQRMPAAACRAPPLPRAWAPRSPNPAPPSRLESRNGEGCRRSGRWGCGHQTRVPPARPTGAARPAQGRQPTTNQAHLGLQFLPQVPDLQVLCGRQGIVWREARPQPARRRQSEGGGVEGGGGAADPVPVPAPSCRFCTGMEDDRSSSLGGGEGVGEGAASLVAAGEGASPPAGDSPLPPGLAIALTGRGGAPGCRGATAGADTRPAAGRVFIHVIWRPDRACTRAGALQKAAQGLQGFCIGKARHDFFLFRARCAIPLFRRACPVILDLITKHARPLTCQRCVPSSSRRPEPPWASTGAP